MSKIIESYSGKTEGGTPYSVTVVKRESKIPEAKFVTSGNKNSSFITGIGILSVLLPKQHR